MCAGELVWSRQHFIKDPSSGKRVTRPNPRSAWISEPVPELRIVEPALWNAVEHRLEVARVVVTDERFAPRALSGDNGNCVAAMWGGEEAGGKTRS